MSDGTSFAEAVEVVAKRRNISEDEAALIVAEEYGAVAAYEEGEIVEHLLDDEDAAEVWLRQHAPTYGRAVALDEGRSAQGTIHAQAERMQAKREGDRYRDLSRRTSME